MTPASAPPTMNAHTSPVTKIRTAIQAAQATANDAPVDRERLCPSSAIALSSTSGGSDDVPSLRPGTGGATPAMSAFGASYGFVPMVRPSSPMRDRSTADDTRFQEHEGRTRRKEREGRIGKGG